VRVLHVAPSFWPNIGGVEKYILEMSRESRAAGMVPRVLTLRDRPGMSRSEEVDGIGVARVPFLDLRYYKPAVLPLALLRWPDVIHVHNVGAMTDFVAATRGLHRRPIVLSTHGGIFHTTARSSLKKAYFGLLQPKVLRAVDRVLADSGGDLELFEPLGRPITLFEPGVDLSRFASGAEERDPGCFLYVGRLSRNKRLDRLLRAFGGLAARGVRFRLRIVGPDWDALEGELRALADVLGIGGKVSFVGAVSEEQLLEEYHRATVFVSASEYEGFGISLVEAMAAGCVPVVEANDSFSRIVSDRKDGFLTSFDRPDEAAALLQRALTGSGGQMAEAARHAATRYAWPAKIEALRRVYQAVAESR
jgi:alpha-1,3-mannosyltransferase